MPLDKVFGEKLPGKEERLPVKYFYYFGWVVILLVAYERIGFQSEQYVRNSIKLKKEVDDLRAEYTSIHAEYMKSGKQSVVIEKVKEIGLEENLTPPKKDHTQGRRRLASCSIQYPNILISSKLRNEERN